MPRLNVEGIADIRDEVNAMTNGELLENTVAMYEVAARYRNGNFYDVYSYMMDVLKRRLPEDWMNKIDSR